MQPCGARNRRHRYTLEVNKDKYTGSRARLLLARILTSTPVGTAIGFVARQRVRHLGITFDTSDPVFTPSIRAQLAWGIYESAETRLVARYLRNSRAVIELGSSLGVVSAHIARQMPAGGHLVCVEANPRLHPVLVNTLTEHAAHLHVTRINAAVTNAEGPAMLEESQATTGSRVVAESATGLAIRVLTLNDLLREVRVAGEFDLVCDIEGSEASLILGDAHSLARCRTAVFELHNTTFHGRTVSVEDLISSLRDEHGFEVLARRGNVIAVRRTGSSAVTCQP